MTAPLHLPARASRVLAILLLTLLGSLGLAGTASAQLTSIPANYLSVADQDGANDQPSQVDLTRFGRDDSDADVYKLLWSWDSSTDWTGNGQTGDACALFDGDGDGNVNFVVCARVENPDADTTRVTQMSPSPYLFNCSDAKDDRCANPGPALAYTGGQLQSGALQADGSILASPPASLITNTDPFLNLQPDQDWNKDSTIAVNILKSLLPANAVLINVCSYPSAGAGGNNNPFDCIIRPGDGLLEIQKVTTSASGQEFEFTTGPASTDAGTYFLQGGETTGAFGATFGDSLTVHESIPTGWVLHSAVCTLEGTTTQTGTVTATGVNGITIQPGKVTTCVFTNRPNPPEVTVVKSNDADHDGTFNDTESVPAGAVYPYRVTYQAVISNAAGATSATITHIVDDKVPASLTSAAAGDLDCADAIGDALPAAGSVTCYFDAMFTTADLGQVVNTVTATASNGVDPDSDTDTSTVDFSQVKTIGLAKSAVLDAAGATPVPGDEIDYSFVITNTGNVTLTGVDLDDSLLGYADVTCGGITTLAPGASAGCTGNYVLTQADIDAGTVTNQADACGDPPAGAEVCDADSTTTPLNPGKGIELDKTAALDLGLNGVLNAGDKVNYGFRITNIGSVTLTGVDLDDSLLGYSDVTCGSTSLAPGAFTTCTGQRTLTQADIDAGSVVNTARACGAPPIGAEVCHEDATTTPLAQVKDIDLDKTAVLNAGATPVAGDTIAYSFVITNAGNVTLTGVDLDDALLGFSDATCGATTLAPGASTDCTATYTLTQANINAGSVANSATACGSPPSGPDVCATDGTTTPLAQVRDIDLDKTAVLNAGATPVAGDTITYSFVLTNAGNVTLTGVDLDDALVGGTDATCGATTLAPGASTDCTAVYTLTQANINAGVVTNSATACGSPPSGADVCATDGTTTSLNQVKTIDLEKFATLDAGNDGLAAGDTIHYEFIVINTGNVTLTGVDLDDALVGFSNAACGATTLAPGASTDCTVDYTLTQADIDAGSVTNVANVCGDPPTGDAVCDDDTTTTVLDPDKGIQLEKTGVLNASGTAKAGDTITFTFDVTNTGNVTLAGVDLDDALLGLADVTCGVTSLAPGATAQCARDHTLTQADIDKGSVTNIADVCADPPSGDEVCDEDTTTTDLPQAKGIDVVKAGPGNAYHGDQVTYTFVVTNTGGVTLSAVSVTDDKCAPVVGPTSFRKGDGDALLEVGEEWLFTCTMTLGAHAAGEANPIVNTVTATGTDPQGAAHSDTDTHETRLLHPAVQIVKSGPASIEAGQRVPYMLTVTNPGDVPLNGQTLSVTDRLCDAPPQLSGKFTGEKADATPDTLDPGDRWIYGCFVPTVAGQAEVVNTAQVDGSDPNGRSVSDADVVTTPLTQPRIEVLPEMIESGAAKLAGPSRCVSKAFTARVTGKRIKSVTWFVDGKRVKRFTSRTGEARKAGFKVNPAMYGTGVHRLRATIRFNSASRTRSRTLRMTFQECAKQIIAPQFTG